MTILQRLRGMLTTDPHIAALSAAQLTYDAAGASIAEQLRRDWEYSTVRDPEFRESAKRAAVQIDHAAVSCVWRYSDGSRLVANDHGVWVF